MKRRVARPATDASLATPAAPSVATAPELAVLTASLATPAAPSVAVTPRLAVLAVSLALSLLTHRPCVAADPTPARYPDGASVFQANCAVCHGPKGAGQPSLAPSLTSYPARYASSDAGRTQLAMTVLNGMFGSIEVEHQHFDFQMPGFMQLDDATLAAVLNFIVFDLGHAAENVKPIATQEIAAERAHPIDPATVREHRTKLLAALGL